MTEATRQQLIQDHMRLAHIITNQFIRRYRIHTVELRDDMLSSAMVGLVSAANRFDAARGVQFNTYAERRIRGAIHDYMRQADWASRGLRRRLKAGTAEIHHLTLDDDENPIDVPVPATAEQAAVAAVQLAYVERIIRALPTLERYCMIRHYYDEVTHEVLGAELGISPSRVTQLIIHARGCVRRQLRREGRLEAA